MQQTALRHLTIVLAATRSAPVPGTNTKKQPVRQYHQTQGTFASPETFANKSTTRCLLTRLEVDTPFSPPAYVMSYLSDRADPSSLAGLPSRLCTQRPAYKVRSICVDVSHHRKHTDKIAICISYAWLTERANRAA